MTSIEKRLFEQLKAAISIQLRSSHPNIAEDTKSWKRREIELFQKELLEKVHGRISEKWFYTHLKADHRSLPRIDMLDLLSRYVGYENWSAFKNDFSGKTPLKRNYLITGILTLATVTVMAVIMVSNVQQVRFCFQNMYSQQMIPAEQLQIEWVKTGETPRLLKADDQGCVCVQSKDRVVTLQVRSPYYKDESIIRKIDKQKMTEVISLRTDDYARAIRIFSQRDEKEWSKCRSFLSGVIRENARIYQYSEDGTNAIDVYNKQEFIDKLTSPTRLLKNLEIIELSYEDHEIAVLRFKEKSHD